MTTKKIVHPDAAAIHKRNIELYGVENAFRLLNETAKLVLAKREKLSLDDIGYHSPITISDMIEDQLIQDIPQEESREGFYSFQDILWIMGQADASRDQRRGTSKLPSQKAAKQKYNLVHS